VTVPNIEKNRVANIFLSILFINRKAGNRK
jgi:hypothetical protein